MDATLQEVMAILAERDCAQVFADTFLFTPFHVIGYFAFMNAVEGGSLQVSKRAHFTVCREHEIQNSCVQSRPHSEGAEFAGSG